MKLYDIEALDHPNEVKHHANQIKEYLRKDSDPSNNQFSGYKTDKRKLKSTQSIVSVYRSITGFLKWIGLNYNFKNWATFKYPTITVKNESALTYSELKPSFESIKNWLNEHEQLAWIPDDSTISVDEGKTSRPGDEYRIFGRAYFGTCYYQGGRGRVELLSIKHWGIDFENNELLYYNKSKKDYDKMILHPNSKNFLQEYIQWKEFEGIEFDEESSVFHLNGYALQNFINEINK